MNFHETLNPNSIQAALGQSHRRPPHNLEAEQALLGAILVNNEAMMQVSGFLTSGHFFVPLHGEIYRILGSLIGDGKLATPVIVKTYFDDAPPVDANTTVAQYLGRLAANATTIINADAYGRTVYDLATRRSLIVVGEDLVDRAYAAEIGNDPEEQIADIQDKLRRLQGIQSRKRTYLSTQVDEIESKPISWLWPKRIALGKLSLLAGNPGLGKSQISLVMAAIVSNGGIWPDGSTCPKGSVVIISCEDDPSDTIRPRLEAAGADLSKIAILEAVIPSGNRELAPDFRTDG